jgi:large subunit ribosomal protein L16
MLQPNNTKYKKVQKGKIKKIEIRATKLRFGSYGLKTLESTRLTLAQLEATRRAIIQKLKRRGKLWIRIFPDLPVTKKPNEIRMGKGKGSVND